MSASSQCCRRRRLHTLAWAAAGLAAVLLSPAETLAQGATLPRTYAVMSLVGDALRVVGHEASIGSRLDQNPVEEVKLSADTLDRGALAALQAALQKADPGAKVLPIRVNEPRYYAEQGQWVSPSKATLPAEIVEALRQAQVTHLLLVTRWRAQANLRVVEGGLGTAKLEGLGYYIDRVTPMRHASTGERSVGYLAPYVHVQLSLVDLAGAQALRAQRIATGDVLIAAGRQVGGDPWDILDSKAKVTALGDLLNEHLGAALPALLKSSP